MILYLTNQKIKENMNIKWLVQHSSVSDTHLTNVVESIKKSKTKYDFFGVIPFCQEITGLEDCLEKDTCYVIHGSVKILDIFSKTNSLTETNPNLNNWQKSMDEILLKRLKSGIFHDKNLFDQRFYNKLDLPILNKDSQILSCSEQLDTKFDEDLFIKPSSDTKAFDAGIIPKGISIKEHIESGFYKEHYKNEFILISSLKDIKAEYRFFVVDKKVISGSSYRINGHLKSTQEIPENVSAAAIEFSQMYQPADVFTMDLAIVDNTVRIVEYNCFNCSGIYATDYSKVVKAVNNHILKNL